LPFPVSDWHHSTMCITIAHTHSNTYTCDMQVQIEIPVSEQNWKRDLECLNLVLKFIFAQCTLCWVYTQYESDALVKQAMATQVLQSSFCNLRPSKQSMQQGHGCHKGPSRSVVAFIVSSHFHDAIRFSWGDGTCFVFQPSCMFFGRICSSNWPLCEDPGCSKSP